MSTSTATELPRMGGRRVLAWAMEQPEGEHYELHDGVIVRMPNEATLHDLTKGLIFYRNMQANEKAGLTCDVYVDAMAVQITARTVFEPDIVVRCAERLPDAR